LVQELTKKIYILFNFIAVIILILST